MRRAIHTLWWWVAIILVGWSPNQEAVTVTEKLVDGIFMRFSTPEQLYTDQGKQFELNLMKETSALKKLLISKRSRDPSDKNLRKKSYL